MLHLLHDEIDSEEESRERARGLVEKYKDAGLVSDIMHEAGDTETALEEIAALVAGDLAGLTTEEVRLGFEAAKRRAKA